MEQETSKTTKALTFNGAKKQKSSKVRKKANEIPQSCPKSTWRLHTLISKLSKPTNQIFKNTTNQSLDQPHLLPAKIQNSHYHSLQVEHKKDPYSKLQHYKSLQARNFLIGFHYFLNQVPTFLSRKE